MLRLGSAGLGSAGFGSAGLHHVVLSHGYSSPNGSGNYERPMPSLGPNLVEDEAAVRLVLPVAVRLQYLKEVSDQQLALV